MYLKAFGKLPDYYITKDEAMQKYGWSRGKDLSRFAPNKMIGEILLEMIEVYYPKKTDDFGMNVTLTI